MIDLGLVFLLILGIDLEATLAFQQFPLNFDWMLKD
jgi:hypothetical protein